MQQISAKAFFEYAAKFDLTENGRVNEMDQVQARLLVDRLREKPNKWVAFIDDLPKFTEDISDLDLNEAQYGSSMSVLSCYLHAIGDTLSDTDVTQTAQEIHQQLYFDDISMLTQFAEEYSLPYDEILQKASEKPLAELSESDRFSLLETMNKMRHFFAMSEDDSWLQKYPDIQNAAGRILFAMPLGSFYAMSALDASIAETLQAIEKGTDFAALGELHAQAEGFYAIREILKSVPERIGAIAFETDIDAQPYLDRMFEALKAWGTKPITPELSIQIDHWLNELVGACSGKSNITTTDPYSVGATERYQFMKQIFIEAMTRGISVHAIDRYDPNDGISRDALMANAMTSIRKSTDASKTVLFLGGSLHVERRADDRDLSEEFMMQNDIGATSMTTHLENEGHSVFRTNAAFQRPGQADPKRFDSVVWVKDDQLKDGRTKNERSFLQRLLSIFS